MTDGARLPVDPAVALARRIVVAIPVLNEEAHIKACLASLMNGVDALNHVQFAVADGGSTDCTRDIVEDLRTSRRNLHLLDNPGKLQSAGVNIVAREGGKDRDILVRCDAHSHYPENFVLSVARALIDRDCDSLVVPMDAEGDDCFARANGWVVDTPLGSGGSAHRGGTASGWVDHGHHAAFLRKRFAALGGYDESFSHNEDAEYDARLSRAGGKIWLEADLRIRYCPRPTPGGLWRQYAGYGKGRARNLLKNRNTPRLRQMAPVVNLGLFLASLCLLPITPLALAWPVFYGAVLAAASGWFMITKRSPCGIWAGPAAAIMHFSWGLGFVKGVWHHYRFGLSKAG